MNETIEKYISAIIKAKGGKEKLFGIPTDIIGFGEFGRNLAHALEPLVTKKEICFFDLNIKHDDNFHFLDFRDMFKKSELMIFTHELPEEFLNDLSDLNQSITIIIDGKFITTIKILSDNGFLDNLIVL